MDGLHKNAADLRPAGLPLRHHREQPHRLRRLLRPVQPISILVETAAVGAGSTNFAPPGLPPSRTPPTPSLITPAATTTPSSKAVADARAQVCRRTARSLTLRTP
ncbi:MAG: hypothetical protein ACLUJG_08420 [Lawsonibacter sp.]